jgi:hypothetical protein
MDVVDERNTVSAFPQQQQQQDVNNFEMNVDEEPAKAVETARGSPWGQFHNDIANKEDNNSSRQHQQWPWNMETAVAHVCFSIFSSSIKSVNKRAGNMRCMHIQSLASA